MKPVIIIFAKNLILGQVKSRLAATIGNNRALKVYQHLLHHTAAVTNNLPIDKIVFYSTVVEKKDLWNNDVYKKQLQSGKDLGERMQNAFDDIFALGIREVAIIGTDCLEITPDIIMDGFANLKNNDVVIGPASDGGYYLLAIKQRHHALFQNMEWSTDAVLKNTLAICTQLNLTVYLLPQLSDVDNEHDLSEEQKITMEINLKKND